MNKEKNRILVVDDEESVTRMLKLNLEETGVYEVATENNPRHVLHRVREFRPDLVILDILMPNMTGDYVAQQLRDIPAFKAMPIIFLTAIGKESSEAFTPDVDPVICKPVEMARLIPVIRERLASSTMPPASAPGLSEMEIRDSSVRPPVGIDPAE
jgi:two-component system, OmpR family, phosphate regulon response regulator PhoB